MAKKPGMKTIKVTTSGHLSLAGALDYTSLIVLRKGNAIGKAKVLNKDFTIDTADLGPMKIQAKLIETIILKNLPLYPLDMIRLSGGNEISGTVTTDPVRIDSKQLAGPMDIPIGKILSILF
jgi:hypothetical protein